MTFSRTNTTTPAWELSSLGLALWKPSSSTRIRLSLLLHDPSGCKSIKYLGVVSRYNLTPHYHKLNSGLDPPTLPIQTWISKYFLHKNTNHGLNKFYLHKKNTYPMNRIYFLHGQMIKQKYGFENLLRYRLFIIKISWLKIWINDDNAFNSGLWESFCQSCDFYHVSWSQFGEKSWFKTDIYRTWKGLY